MSRPLIVSDCDEVLLHMVAPFRDWLAETQGVTFRMDSADPAIMMPELGRSVVHREGVELIRAWIDAQPGSCDTATTTGSEPPPAR